MTRIAILLLLFAFIMPVVHAQGDAPSGQQSGDCHLDDDVCRILAKPSPKPDPTGGKPDNGGIGSGIGTGGTGSNAITKDLKNLQIERPARAGRQ